MPEPELKKLLGGFAADQLTSEERQKLFSAALQDQELINARADEQGLKELSETPEADRTKRVVKLNDLKQQLEEQRQKLGAKDELQKQLDNMKNLGAGPAEKAAQAMKEGNWEQAKQEIEKLQKQLQEGQLDEKAKQELAKQLEQIKEKLEAAANARQQAEFL